MCTLTNLSQSIAFHNQLLQNLPPAEDTLVSTSQTGCGLHATMTLNTIERVLVASTTPT